MIKRAQVTVFIIVAIVIVGAIVGFFYVKNKTSSLASAIPAEIQPINAYVKNCIEETVIDGLNANSQRGGYYDAFGYIDVGAIYYIANNKSQIPDRKTLEFELEKYSGDKFGDCIDNFSSFKAFKIMNKKINITISIYDKIILVHADYPLTITQENMHWQLREFKNIDILTNYGLLSSIATNISKKYLETNSFSLTYMSEIKANYNITTDLQYSSRYNLIDLIDTQGIQNKSSLEFKFAIS